MSVSDELSFCYNWKLIISDEQALMLKWPGMMSWNTELGRNVKPAVPWNHSLLAFFSCSSTESVECSCF